MGRQATLVLVGVMLALLGAELAARAIGAELPDPRPWPTPETQIKYSQIEDLRSGGVDLDVVFIGSSVVESGIDPDLLERRAGVVSYNAALPFSSPLGNDIWLRDFVLPRMQPTAVVVGLGVWPNESTAQNDLLARGLGDVEDSTRGWSLGSELLQRRRQLRNWSETLESRRRAESGLITPRGHQTVYYGRTRPVGGEPQFTATQTGYMSADNHAALVRTIETLLSSDIDPVILIEPIGCPPVLDECGVFDLAEHPGYAVADEYGLQVIDAASRDWPSEMFADSAHFNRAGAEAFTDFVGAELMATIEP